jgi:transposase
MSMSNTTKRVKDIRRNTRRKFSSEEKIRIVLDGLRGESSIAELCRQEGINSNLYYRWSKDFLEAGKKRLSGDTVREANSDEVVGLRKENTVLKQAVAELYLRNDWLKKSLTGQGVTLEED